MKITPKSPSVSRPAEPPGKGGNSGIVPPKHGNGNTGIVPPKLPHQNGNTGIVPPKAGNTGIVPPKSGNTGIVPPGGVNSGIVPPSDSFQPTTSTAGKGGTSAASGAAATSLNGTSGTTYALAPNLEQFRQLFDTEGERISKLPTEQQAGEIELTSSRLFEQLKDYGTFDEVKGGVTASRDYYASRRSGGDDPMTYAFAADVAAKIPSGEDSGGPSGDFGASINVGSPPRETESLPSNGKQNRMEEETHHHRFRRMRRHHF